MRITTLGLDADDTLWHNETIFRLTQDRFRALMADEDDVEALDDHLDDVGEGPRQGEAPEATQRFRVLRRLRVGVSPCGMAHASPRLGVRENGENCRGNVRD